jgi:hypothetical protein
MGNHGVFFYVKEGGWGVNVNSGFEAGFFNACWVLYNTTKNKNKKKSEKCKLHI